VGTFQKLSTDEKAVQLQKRFVGLGYTLSIAESCTGGQISGVLTAQPGSSKYFLGSVISYHKSLKIEVLKVPASTIANVGEVSLQVAVGMARGVKKLTNSTWAVSVTGIAGPGGGTSDKPVGTVCFAVVGPGFEESRLIQFAASDRQKIQGNSVDFALSFLWDSTHNKETI
jgi:PncC family amidohydrolase